MHHALMVFLVTPYSSKDAMHLVDALVRSSLLQVEPGDFMLEIIRKPLIPHVFLLTGIIHYPTDSQNQYSRTIRAVWLCQCQCNGFAPFLFILLDCCILLWLISLFRRSQVDSHIQECAVSLFIVVLHKSPKLPLYLLDRHPV